MRCDGVCVSVSTSVVPAWRRPIESLLNTSRVAPSQCSPRAGPLLAGRPDYRSTNNQFRYKYEDNWEYSNGSE